MKMHETIMKKKKLK